MICMSYKFDHTNWSPSNLPVLSGGVQNDIVGNSVPLPCYRAITVPTVRERDKNEQPDTQPMYVWDTFSYL